MSALARVLSRYRLLFSGFCRSVPAAALVTPSRLMGHLSGVEFCPEHPQHAAGDSGMEKLFKTGVCSHDLSLMEKHQFEVTMLGVTSPHGGDPLWSLETESQSISVFLVSVSVGGKQPLSQASDPSSLLPPFGRSPQWAACSVSSPLRTRRTSHPHGRSSSSQRCRRLWSGPESVGKKKSAGPGRRGWQPVQPNLSSWTRSASRPRRPARPQSHWRRRCPGPLASRRLPHRRTALLSAKVRGRPIPQW